MAPRGRALTVGAEYHLALIPGGGGSSRTLRFRAAAPAGSADDEVTLLTVE